MNEGTHYTAACNIRPRFTAYIWKAIRELLVQTYAGPPDYLVVDQGSAYVSCEMKRNAEASGLTLKEAPVDYPGTIVVVERYHAPLHAAFERIMSHYGGNVSNKECMRMSVYAVNSRVGPRASDRCSSYTGRCRDPLEPLRSGRN